MYIPQIENKSWNIYNIWLYRGGREGGSEEVTEIEYKKQKTILKKTLYIRNNLYIFVVVFLELGERLVIYIYL